MAYVPPALRKAAAGNPVSPQRTTQRDQKLGEVKSDSPKQYTREDIHEHYWPLTDDVKLGGHQPSTLNGSAAVPDSLTYVMLFKDSNPRWRSDGIIYVKSNLELLPGGKPQEKGIAFGFRDWRHEGKPIQRKESAEGSTDASSPEAVNENNADLTPETVESMKPVAVFEQKGFSHRSGLEFLGYYRIAALQFLEAKSEELIRMLEQKWSLKDARGRDRKIERDESSWYSSLSRRWAVIKLEKDDVATSELGSPNIKSSAQDGTGGPNKSVNEMLKEMRLGQNKDTMHASSGG
ncbi:hypothetical protein K490DRAFT_63591 [Saccharata proteae CBS 121410]|uniref:Uncharacterized protein n=1 Tax=Saccharata proteae CBS 121410 TaxID=1314787 RepID=A0A6A5YD96_9PEZI|nr:hypothetical protein K490DRAFT_63591 [Saccharata proteae CBS 121410]